LTRSKNFSKSKSTTQSLPDLPPQALHVKEQPAWLCPRCSGLMVVFQRLTSEQLFWESLKRINFADTS
jgi:hypothetical protein